MTLRDGDSRLRGATEAFERLSRLERRALDDLAEKVVAMLKAMRAEEPAVYAEVMRRLNKEPVH